MGRYVRTALKERKKEAVTGALVTCLLKLTQTVKFKLKKKTPLKKAFVVCGRVGEDYVLACWPWPWPWLGGIWKNGSDT